MFEDKLKTTDWDATNEAIEEQIARESYLQWARDNLSKNTQKVGPPTLPFSTITQPLYSISQNPKSTSTITSTEAGSSSSPEKSPKHNNSETLLLQHLQFDALKELRKSASPTPNMQCGGSSGTSKTSPMHPSLDTVSNDGSLSPFSMSQNNLNRRKRRCYNQM
jgi:hypothetical protein